MPFVKIDMMIGTTPAKKERLIHGITHSFEDIGIPKDWVHIVIDENPPENWGVRGVQGSKLPKK
jgi:4-oxalocrotonate tautomerase family enzyme